MRGHILLPVFVLSLLQAPAGQGGSLIKQAAAKAQAVSNPFTGSKEASRAASKLFDRECRACHGRKAEGSAKAPALKSAEVSHASAGAFLGITQWLIASRNPSFAHLPEPQRWQIITYLQSLLAVPVVI